MSTVRGAGGASDSIPFIGRDIGFFGDSPRVWMQLEQRKRGGKEVSVACSWVTSTLQLWCVRGGGQGLDAVVQPPLSPFSVKKSVNGKSLILPGPYTKAVVKM